jgi:hypothetical protein
MWLIPSQCGDAHNTLLRTVDASTNLQLTAAPNTFGLGEEAPI